MAVAIPPKRLVRRPVATRKSLPFARLPFFPFCIISLPTPITQAVDVECSGVLRARDLRRTFMLVDRQLGFTVTRRATDKVLSQYEGDGDHAVTAEEVARLVEELQRASPQVFSAALELAVEARHPGACYDWFRRSPLRSSRRTCGPAGAREHLDCAPAAAVVDAQTSHIQRRV